MRQIEVVAKVALFSHALKGGGRGLNRFLSKLKLRNF